MSERHSNKDARKCTPDKYHIHSFLGSKIFTELSFFYIANSKRSLSVSEITIYVMRSVFIGSKYPYSSGVSREEPPHYTIKIMFNNTNRGI